MVRVNLEIHMLEHEIVRPIPNPNTDVGKTSALGKDVGKIDLVFGVWRPRSQRRFRRIQNDARAADLDVSQCARDTVPNQSEQAVFNVRDVDVDGFYIAGAGRERV